MPVAPFENDHAVRNFLKETISMGAYTYNKGYHEICIALYWSALNTLVAANEGVSVNLKGEACDGLVEAHEHPQNDKPGKAWELRHAIDAVLDVIDGHKASWSLNWAKQKAKQCNGVSSPGPVMAPKPQCQTIAELATGNAALSTLLTAVKAADPAILNLLSDPSASLTVFAPSNDAFAAIDPAALNKVLADQALLTNLLKKHVLGSVVPASAALKLKQASVATLAGEDITVDGASGAVKVTPTIVGKEATVVIADVNACNGVVHVVDEVIALDALVEPQCQTIAELATGNAALSTLLTAVKAADPAVLNLLSDPSATLTVFAPTNDAFD